MAQYVYGYMTKDGVFYEDSRRAREHESRIDLINRYKSSVFFNPTQGPNETAANVLADIESQSAEFLTLLREHLFDVIHSKRANEPDGEPDDEFNEEDPKI
jgi:hypothetical protein